jgi:hypothetical protein
MTALWFWLRRFLRAAPAFPHLHWTLLVPPFHFPTRGFSMSTVLPVTHFLPASVQPVDAKGNPAAVDGVAVWETSEPILATLEVADDGLSAKIVPTGVLGHVQIRVRADARMGPDVREISGLLEIELVAAEAVSLNVTAGEPVEIAAEPRPIP